MAAATSVNPIDWKVRSGARQKDFPLTFPAILGQDVSGIVRAVGGNVRTFKPGDRVLGMASAAYAELLVAGNTIHSGNRRPLVSIANGMTSSPTTKARAVVATGIPRLP